MYSYSSKRPKLNIPKTKSEWTWDLIGFTIYLSTIIILIFTWSDLPPEVPAHFNAAGEVDRWGSKWELLILPGIGAFTFMFMFMFEKYPEWHNYPSRFNESNAKSFYLNSRKLLNQTKNMCLILFAVISFESIAISLEWKVNFGAWLLPLLIIAIFVPIIIGLYKRRQIK